MLYFVPGAKGSIEVLTSLTDDARIKELYKERTEFFTRCDFGSLEEAELMAVRAGADDYLAVDWGSGISPRFDVVKKPKIGDLVSYGFNGDCYPDGEIIRIGGGVKMIVTTSTGSRYYRRKNTGAWVKQGGTWRMVMGHHSTRNPHF